MRLQIVQPRYYTVRKGQNFSQIARAFGTTAFALASFNGLTEEPQAGQVLKIPSRSNLYEVRGGESRAKLCGSNERFALLNGTEYLYPRQFVRLEE